jgi:hypothetical protein
MRPGELHTRIVDDHRALRGLLEALERRAQQVLDGELPLVGPLRTDGEALCRRMLDRMDWEDENLAPVLASLEARGTAMEAKLAKDHHEQRELMGYLMEGLQDQNRPPLVIARNLLDLARTLRRDMEDEEQTLRDARILPGETPAAVPTPAPR